MQKQTYNNNNNNNGGYIVIYHANTMFKAHHIITPAGLCHLHIYTLSQSPVCSIHYTHSAYYATRF